MKRIVLLAAGVVAALAASAARAQDSWLYFRAA